MQPYPAIGAAVASVETFYLHYRSTYVLQVELGMTSSGKDSAAASTEWRELRAQVQFLDDECRTLRRKVTVYLIVLCLMLLSICIDQL